MQRITFTAITVILAAFIDSFCCSGRGVAPDFFLDYTQSNPRSFDPALATDITSGKILAKVHRGLFRISQLGKIKNDLVKSYQFKGKNLHLTLEPGARYSNNSLVTSSDVIFCLARLNSKTMLLNYLKTFGYPEKNLQTEGDLSSLVKTLRSSNFAFFFKNISGFTKISEERLIIHFKKDSGSILNLLTLPCAFIYSWSRLISKFIAERPINISRYIYFLGCGPFMVSKFKYNQKIELIRNKYAKQQASLKGYVYHIIKEETSARFLFLKKKLDVLYPPPLLLGNLPERFTYHKKELLAVNYIAINNSKHYLDLHFRRALNFAVNKLQIIDKVLMNLVIASASSVPHSLLQGQKKAPAYPYNLKRSIEELANSKYQGQNLILYVKQDAELITQSRIIAKMAGQAGIKCKVEVFPFKLI